MCTRSLTWSLAPCSVQPLAVERGSNSHLHSIDHFHCSLVLSPWQSPAPEPLCPISIQSASIGVLGPETQLGLPACPPLLGPAQGTPKGQSRLRMGVSRPGRHIAVWECQVPEPLHSHTKPAGPKSSESLTTHQVNMTRPVPAFLPSSSTFSFVKWAPANIPSHECKGIAVTCLSWVQYLLSYSPTGWLRGQSWQHKACTHQLSS